MLKSRCQWLLRAVVLGGEVPRSLWQRPRCSSEKQGCVPQEEGSTRPVAPLCPWKVLSKLLHSGKKPTRSSAKSKPFALVPIIVKSVQGSQRSRAFGSSQGLLPAMRVPSCPQERCGPLVSVPVLFSCAPENGGHQQNVLWLIRVNWQVSCP